MSGKRTIGRLWQDAVAAGHPDPAYLYRHDDHWHGVSWAEAAERVDLIAHGLLARGVRKGDAFGILARTSVEWALFDYALALVGGVTVPVYATGSARDCAFVLAHADAVGVLVDDEKQLAKIEEERASLPALREVLTFADLAGLEEDGRRHRDEHPDAVNEAAAADRGRRSLHVHLHLGHDRPAEGLHDPPPQLLRDDRRDRSSSAVPRARRSLPPLPPARAQLWPPRPPRRPVRRLHDRVRARPLRGRRGARSSSARPCSRAFHACSRRSTPPSSRRSTRRPA